MAVIDLKISLVQKLREVRKATGITQNQLAKLMKSSTPEADGWDNLRAGIEYTWDRYVSWRFYGPRIKVAPEHIGKLELVVAFNLGEIIPVLSHDRPYARLVKAPFSDVFRGDPPHNQMYLFRSDDGHLKVTLDWYFKREQAFIERIDNHFLSRGFTLPAVVDFRGEVFTDYKLTADRHCILYPVNRFPDLEMGHQELHRSITNETKAVFFVLYHSGTAYVHMLTRINRTSRLIVAYSQKIGHLESERSATP